MASHAYLTNEFTEDKKCQNLMSWLKCTFKLSEALSYKSTIHKYFILELKLHKITIYNNTENTFMFYGT